MKIRASYERVTPLWSVSNSHDIQGTIKIFELILASYDYLKQILGFCKSIPNYTQVEITPVPL